MKKVLGLLIPCVAVLVLIGCAPTAKENLDVAVYKNKISNNPCAASVACTAAFNEAKLKINSEDGLDHTEFCDELLTRSDVDLAICEVDIRNEKFAVVIKSCKSTLTERLDRIVKQRNEGLSIQASFAPSDVKAAFEKSDRPKFNTEIQRRDTSKGYFAVTGDVKPGQVILTFDDGPDPVNTLSILQTLSSFGAKAHFFEVGSAIQLNPSITKRVAAEGHTIGNHSWSHPDMRKISFEEGVRQIKKTHSLLLSVLGWADPFFRFPFGNNTPALDQVLYQNQMADFKWAIDSNDWRMHNLDNTVRTNLQVVEDTMNQLNRRGRGIILMHDVHRRTAELLPELLSRIVAKGYTSVILQPRDVSLKTNPPLLSSGKLP